MVKPGYKQTEIGVIPEDWDCREINSEIKEISMGPFGSDIPVSCFTSEGVPVLSGHSVSKAKLVDTFKNYVSEEKAKSLKKAVAQQGDIIVTHRGTIGQISYIPIGSRYKKYVISQSQFRVRLNGDSVNPHFVVSYFLSPKGQSFLLEKKGHTGVPALAQPTTNFRKLCIPLPSLPEQDRIVNAFEDIDDFITLLEKQISKKKAIKQGAMQELLTGKKRLPGFSDEWEKHSFYGVCDISARMVDPTQSEYENYPHIGNESIEKFSGRITHYNKVKEDQLISGKYIFTENDVLYGKINPQFAKATFPRFKGLCSADMYPITCKDQIIPEYLLYILLSSDFTSYTVSLSKRSGIPKVNRDELAEYPMLLPSVEEQRAISDVLIGMDAEIEMLIQKLRRYRQVKQGMMQQLLTGKTRLV